MSNSGYSEMYSLPQVEFLSDSRMAAFVKTLENRNEDVQWHIGRLAGIGGSEAGAILRHLYGVFQAAPGDSFKSADDIVREKLLAKLPMRQTVQAKRGTDIEAFTQAVFRQKYACEVFQEGFEATRRHSAIAAMLGNVDDSLTYGKFKILTDYKSAQEPYESNPFDYVVQLNHYGAIARSNGVHFDKAMIVGIHGAEATLRAMADVSVNRHQDPDTFNFWVETMATKGVPGLELKLYPITLDPNMMGITENAVSHVWNDYVLQGKLLKQEQSASLSTETQGELDRLMAKTTELLGIKAAVEKIVARNNERVNELLVGSTAQGLDVAKRYPINLSERRSLDQDSALSALSAKGVDIETLKVTGKKKSAEALEAALIQAGVDTSHDDFLEKKITASAITGALVDHGLDPEDFKNRSISFATSKAAGKSKQFAELVDSYSESIESLATVQAMHSDVQEDLEQENISSPTLTA